MVKTDELLSNLTGIEIGNALTRYANASKLSEQGNAGFHNSIYRGKSLGTSVTEAQYAAIQDGTFTDMFIGDYWTINSKIYRIAHFDYWLNTGDTACTEHHIVLVPDANMYSAKMNNTNTTEGGYTGSAMYTTNLASAISTIESAFGAAHVLSHRELLSNAVSSGQSSGWAWFDSKVDLMNECMVYGQPVFGKSGYDTGIDKTRLALFKLSPNRITNRDFWWLRSVSSSAYFAYVYSYGNVYNYDALASRGVRPAFGIVA